MKVLIFDTETTDLLPKNIYPTETNLHTFPYIVQLSFILFDTETFEIVEMCDYIIKTPLNVEYNDKSISLHGITKEKSQEFGVDICFAINDFEKYYNICDMVVAHNFRFDNNILIIEALRCKRKTIINIVDNKKPIYCTMQNSIELCNLVRVNQYGTYKKFPKQSELHEKLFDEFIDDENLHNSLHDILVCLRCFMKMTQNIDILEKCHTLSTYYKINILGIEKVNLTLTN